MGADNEEILDVKPETVPEPAAEPETAETTATDAEPAAAEPTA